MSEELLKLNKLCVDYRVKEGYLSVVKNVSFSIDKGEIFAIVGESGCGKSTIAHSILHLLPQHNEIIKGNIFFNGEDLNGYSDKQLEHISVPRLTENNPGCRFENRCPYAMDICKTKDPERRIITESHSFNCHLENGGEE